MELSSSGQDALTRDPIYSIVLLSRQLVGSLLYALSCFFRVSFASFNKDVRRGIQ